MVKIKICGITNLEDAQRASKAGADLLGFIFIKNVPRYIDNIQDIIISLPPEVKKSSSRVGLFKDERIDIVQDMVLKTGLDYVQLVGSETPEYCNMLKESLRRGQNRNLKIIKAIKVAKSILVPYLYNLNDYIDADFFCFDTFHPSVPGGTGKRFDLEVLMEQKGRIKKPFFIAGGLTPLNVAHVIKEVQPYGVDASSGVEILPGKKDAKKIKEFIENAKNA